MSDTFPEKIDALWLDCHIATVSGDDSYGVIENGAMAICEGRIVWTGSAEQLPSGIEQGSTRIHRLNGAWITPGLIDCHTHLVYAGNRVSEYEMRLNGASYEEVARAGGGIVSTVKSVRAAKEQELLEQSLPRLSEMLAHGVTTVEIKSGYGLDVANELKMLRVIKQLKEKLPVSIQATFLGAHAIPTEFKERADDYIDLVCSVMLPEIAKEGLADSVDAFCENIAFSEPQVRAVFEKAHALGLPVRLHADQLSNSHGARLAAEFSALSADHLEYTDEAGVRALKQAGTVAVLLPGAFYFLKEQQRPPVNLFRKHQVPMALASDCNPGSSPVESLLLILNMGCVLFGLTPREAVAGVTVHAAKALGYADRGVLAAGKRADFAVFEVESLAQLCYPIGTREPSMVVQAGNLVS